MLDLLDGIKINKLIQFMKPLGFFFYFKLQINSYCNISDSGTITEESSLLNFPAITIRNTHERPEGMDEGTLIMSGLKKEDIMNSIRIVTNQNLENKKILKIQDYNSDNISTKIVRIVQSYTNYINRTVWHK